jgi:hypothetical protein
MHKPVYQFQQDCFGLHQHAISGYLTIRESCLNLLQLAWLTGNPTHHSFQDHTVSTGGFLQLLTD